MDMNDPADIGKIGDAVAKPLDTPMAIELYGDMVSRPAKQVGELAVDALKTFRLLLAPFQLGAHYQDRFRKWLDNVRDSVPTENQVDAPASIAGPVIKALMFLEEGDPLVELYLNLLRRAIDKERQDEAHPAFARIIEQLSPDEAAIYLAGSAW